MLIKIVTHCWNPPGTTVYSELLKWQVRSLAENPCRHHVILQVFHSRTDIETFGYLRDLSGGSLPSRFKLTADCVPEHGLFRRAIGRNLACATSADIVWFTDCDYLFGEGCIDTLTSQQLLDDHLYFPHYIQTSTTHEEGTRFLETATSLKEGQFYPRRMRRAIGGIQIVTGNTARNHGYLRGTEWVRPLEDTSQGFLSCRCDAQYRRTNKFPQVPLDLPNVYRIRHEINGRDFDLEGKPIVRISER